MRKVLPALLEAARVKTGYLASTAAEGVCGAFHLMGPCGLELAIIASNGDDPAAEGWQHVSVSTSRRNPNWEEMCWVKDLFWDEEDCVVQFHPPKSVYKNVCKHCLHLWSNEQVTIPLPPLRLV